MDSAGPMSTGAKLLFLFPGTSTRTSKMVLGMVAAPVLCSIASCRTCHNWRHRKCCLQMDGKGRRRAGPARRRRAGLRCRRARR